MIERVPVLVVAADGAPALEIARVARESGCSPILCDDRPSARRALVANRLFIAVVEAGDNLDHAADLCSWLRQQPGGRQLRIIACKQGDWLELLPLIDAGADDIASYLGNDQSLGGRLTIATARLLSRHRESPIDFLAGTMDERLIRPHLLPHELLFRIRQMAWDETELSRLYRSFVEGAAAAFGFSQIAIYAIEDSMLVLQHLVGFDRSVERIPFERGIIGKTARTDRPIVIEDVTRDPDYIGGGFGVNSEICVPFHADGRVMGVINIESIADSVLDHRDLPLVLALRDHIESAIARINAFDRVSANDQAQRSMFRHIPSGMFALNSALEIEEINPIAASLLGQPEPELIGHPLASVLELGDVADFERAIRTIRNGGRSEASFAFTLANGTSLKIELAANPEAAASAQSLYGVITDITSQRATEEHLTFARQILAGFAAGGTIVGLADSNGVLHLATDNGDLPAFARRASGSIDLRAIIDERDWPEIALVLSNPSGGSAHLRVRAGTNSNPNRWFDLLFAPGSLSDKRFVSIREAGVDAAREQELQASVRRYQDSFDNSIAPSAILEITGRFKQVSEAMASLLGYDRTDLEGMAFQQLTYPEDVEATVTSFRKLVSGEVSTCIARRRFFHRDGYAIPVLIRAVATPNESEAPPDFLLTMVSMERVQELEERLADVTNRYDAMVNALPIVTYTSPRDASDTKNLFFSSQIENLLGYPSDGLFHNIDQLYDFIHPDDLDRVSAADIVAETENAAFDEIYRMIRSDGRMIWVRAQSAPVFTDADEALFWQGVLTDVTALKESEIAANEREARLRDLIANAPMLIATLDPDAAITTINDAVERMLGYRAGDLTSGRLALDVHPDDRNRLRTLFSQTLQTPGFVGTGDVRFKHRDGHWVLFHIEAVNRPDSQSAAGVLVYGLPIEE
jgi:PAS domain S-box-containing protein